MSEQGVVIPYEVIGGEAATRRLAARFYDLMDTLPEAAEIRAIHPASLDGSREKFFEFLSGWLGGPQLYMEKRGHPRLRMRHFPFAIGKRERDQWMLCMRLALAEVVEDLPMREALERAFAGVADHMINRPA